MNKKLKLLLAIVLLPLSVVIPVLSLDSHYSTHTSAQANDSALSQRIEKYKTKLKEDFRQADQDRLKLRCSVVQTNVKNLSNRLGNIQETREQAYDAILADLNDLLAQLDSQGFDAAVLQANVSELSDQVESYKTLMNNYKQAVDDMVVIDCTQEPTSFKAALESARADHQALITSVADIRNNVTNTIKPTLQNVRSQINDDQSGGN